MSPKLNWLHVPLKVLVAFMSWGARENSNILIRFTWKLLLRGFYRSSKWQIQSKSTIMSFIKINQIYWLPYWIRAQHAKCFRKHLEPFYLQNLCIDVNSLGKTRYILHRYSTDRKCILKQNNRVSLHFKAVKLKKKMFWLNTVMFTT